VPEARRNAFLDSFVARATESFLAGYRKAMGGEETPADQALLDLFLIEKAAYEIAYEAANRPTWIDVPLRGLARLADALLSAETAS
jgi:maltose alpha-D-glucosyltransferase/alpha-amylase